jgi:hypothetical protein
MTVALGIEVGAEIETGGCAGAGLGAGQSQAAAVFPSGKGQCTSWLSANHENSTPSVAGTESFRSRWQATLNALVPRPIAGQKAGLSAGQGTGSGTGQGTAVGTRLGKGIEAESADEQSDVSGEVGGAVEAPLPQGWKSGAAAVSLNAEAVPRWMQVTEQKGEPVAGTTVAMLAHSQSGISGWMVAAPHVQSVNVVLTSEASGDARTGRSVKSDKRDSTAQRLNAEPQAAASNNGTLATPIAVTANSLTPAPAMQAQILPANFLGSPQSILADRIPSSDREPDTAADAVAGSAATVKNGARGTAGIAARSKTNSRATTGIPVTATPGGSEDGEASGVPSLALGDAEAAAAKELTELSRAAGTQAEGTQLESAPSQHRTESGSPLVETAKTPAVNSGTYHTTYLGTNLGAEGNSAFASQSPAAATVTDESNSEGSKQSPEEATARLAHRDSASDVTQPAMYVVLAQQAGVSVEASGMARVPAGADGTANIMTAHAGVTAGTAAGTATGETFAAMDAGTEVGTPSWIHAGGQTAEAGFQDPVLGWVGVRADLSGGNIHAALMPGSSEAAQTLSGHLAGLNSYLAEQHTPVATLTMAAASGGGVEAGAGQSMQQGAGQNLGQDPERNIPTQSQSSPQPGAATIPAAAQRGTVTENGGSDGVVPLGEMRGRHISVMA